MTAPICLRWSFEARLVTTSAFDIERRSDTVPEVDTFLSGVAESPRPHLSERTVVVSVLDELTDDEEEEEESSEWVLMAKLTFLLIEVGPEVDTIFDWVTDGLSIGNIVKETLSSDK